MINSNMPVPDISKIKKKLTDDKKVAHTENHNKLQELLQLAQISNVPQIILDSFENNFSSNYNFNLDNEALIQRAMLCYKEYHNLIGKLPQDLSTAFIYEYCVYQDEEDEVIENYSYYRGYKGVFYLLHCFSGVFIVFDGLSLQKDAEKYASDFSWGYMDLSSHDTFPNDKRISNNTIQTAEVILQAIFPNDDSKLNLVPLFIESFLIHKTIYKTNSSFTKENILDWYDNLNLIKRVCLEQKITYKEFGIQVGFKEGAIKNAAASGKISEQLRHATQMYLEIQRLTQENKKFKKFQELMKEITSI